MPRSVGSAAEGLAVTAELSWALGGAFGEVAGEETSGPDGRRIAPLEGGPQGSGPRGLDGDAAVATARRLGLLPRVVDRLGPDRLAAEVGPEAASKALEEYRASALGSAKRVALTRLVGRVAGASGIRVVALKHAALCLAGVSSPAARAAADADVLVSDADAARLTAALTGEGFVVSDAPGYDHQHPPLIHPRGGVLELHRTVPAVRLSPREREASLETFVVHGLATPLSADAPYLLVPRPHVLLAHALAHGLFQHGLEPAAYPGFKMLADLADLKRHAGAGLIEEALPLVAAEVNEDDARAAWALPSLLAERGATGVLGRAASAEARLLAHLVRGALEPEYGASIRLRSVLALPSDRAGLGGLLGEAWRAVAINRAQARELYGVTSPAGYALALAFRPLHLAAKLVRYALAAR